MPGPWSSGVAYLDAGQSAEIIFTDDTLIRPAFAWAIVEVAVGAPVVVAVVPVVVPVEESIVPVTSILWPTCRFRSLSLPSRAYVVLIPAGDPAAVVEVVPVVPVVVVLSLEPLVALVRTYGAGAMLVAPVVAVDVLVPVVDELLPAWRQPLTVIMSGEPLGRC
jgi:hypothetical protein